jgi:CHAD domain-containing protein
MSFRIRRNERIDDAVLRVVRAQLRDAIQAAQDGRVSEAERVHKVRTRLKRPRAALALIQDRAGKKAARDARRLRDAGRKLADARDLAVLAGTFDALKTGAGRELAVPLGNAGQRFRAELADVDLGQALEKSARQLRKLRRKVGDWPMKKTKRRAVAAEGVSETHDEAARAAREALIQPTPARLHDWRKRVKALSYQMRLVGGKRARGLAPVEKLGEILGQIHDLDVAREVIEKHPRRFGEQAPAAIGLLAQRRTDLVADAFTRADELFSEKRRPRRRRT